MSNSATVDLKHPEYYFGARYTHDSFEAFFGDAEVAHLVAEYSRSPGRAVASLR